MSDQYKGILWNRFKKRYDVVLWVSILCLCLIYGFIQFLLNPTITIETVIIRATALVAFLLLHFILIIGPLCRIDNRFLPLLYNRRHLGVSMFLIALIHGVFCTIQFHALGDINALVSIFVSNQNYQEISAFPFQILGFFALLILFTMAATSHDFWLKNLGPKFWKSLHMLVYVAYGLIVLHVALGAFQYESHIANWILLFIGFFLVVGLHIYSAMLERKRLKAMTNQMQDDGFHFIGPVSSIGEKCATTVFFKNENIAIFKYDNKISAVNNICKHQMGPLGEGMIIDGCITCPWHGYQYLPESGQSPPPFNEKVKTYEVKVVKDSVWVNPTPKEEGTYVKPAEIDMI